VARGALQEIYGEGYLRNLSTLGEDAECLATMVSSGFLQPFWKTVQRSSVAVWVDCAPFVDQPIFFWKVSLPRKSKEPSLGNPALPSQRVPPCSHLLLEGEPSSKKQRALAWEPRAALSTCAAVLRLAQEALRHVCHSMGTGMFKDKPLYQFLDRMRAAAAATSGAPPVGWITMKKENATLLLGTSLVIFRCVCLCCVSVTEHCLGWVMRDACLT
jgi:hypothetical protein